MSEPDAPSPSVTHTDRPVAAFVEPLGQYWSVTVYYNHEAQARALLALADGKGEASVPAVLVEAAALIERLRVEVADLPYRIVQRLPIEVTLNLLEEAAAALAQQETQLQAATARAFDAGVDCERQGMDYATARAKALSA